MNKFILVLGIQGSGKTFYSKKWVEEDPEHRVRLNYDDIRNMLGKYWVPSREDVVKTIFNSGLNYSMFVGKDIIIDNFSNLNPKHQKEYENLVKDFNENPENKFNGKSYEIEKVLLDTPIEVCIERDKMRPNPIGEKVIKQCWKQYRNYIIQQSVIKMLDKRAIQNPTLNHAIIVDMDATLCFNTSGRPFYGDGAAEGMESDAPNDAVVDLVANYGELGYKIIIITGREESCRDATNTWCEDIGIFPDYIFMRPNGDYTPGEELKKRLYEENVKDKFYIEFVIDDSSKCVKMWRDLGLLCLQPNEGKF